ncbi:MAG: DUF559 domain-containing protein [Jatrophihabitans sp.]
MVHRCELGTLEVSDAAARWEIARGRWVILFPGVYLTRQEPRHTDWLRAALLHSGSRSVLSGAAALRCHGVRLPRAAMADSILVLIPYGQGVRSAPPARLRRVPHLPEPVVAAGLHVAPVPRAVADLALELRRLDDVRALVADAVQRGFCAPEDLRAQLSITARKNSKAFRTAVAEICDGARSAPEARAASNLRRNGITGFRQNAEVLVSGRRFVADFLWDEMKAILEIDGAEYHFGREGWRRTLDRDAQLQGGGYTVLHAPPSLVDSEAMFIRRVSDWLAARAAMITHFSSL